MEPVAYFNKCISVIGSSATFNWSEIEKAYATRAYHNLDHLREMISHLVAASPSLKVTTRREAIFGIALIYHDVVYRAGSKDNERRSADWAESDLRSAGASTEEKDYCRRLIMATKAHIPVGGNQADQALLVDLDLAVLARDSDGYDVYAKAVRKEFSIYPDFLYKPGRRKALKHFLEQPTIYHTPHFQHCFEAIARKNILRELAGL